MMLIPFMFILRNIFVLYTFLYDTNNRLAEYNGQAVTYDLDGNMLNANG